MNRPAIHRLFALAAVALAAPAASAQIFFDDFDSYKAGSGLAGQGGWDVWCTGGGDATVSDTYANSGSNSLKAIAATDIVQEFNETSGQIAFSFYVYVPSGASGGSGSINLMNAYCPNDFGWSVSTTFNPDTGLVAAYAGNGSTDLILDEWVQYRAEIDLDNDTLNEFYGDTHFVTDATWTANITPGPLAFMAADFYNDALTEVYFDDVSLDRAGVECYADCDGNGDLDLFDFLCFVNDFNVGDDYSDCDGNAAHDLFDFLCFVNAFNQSC